MSIEELKISGIRSYDPREFRTIKFFKPLTVIWGHNGSGKTTIIECLKFISTNTFPPSSNQGKTFLTDPKSILNNQTHSEIMMTYHSEDGKLFKAIRKMQLTANNEMKSISHNLNEICENGKILNIGHRIDDLAKLIPMHLGVTKGILDNVIFCHQENIFWPFESNENLKQIFDDLFETTSYKNLEINLKNIAKTILREIETLKNKLPLYEDNFNEHFEKKQKILNEEGYLIHLIENINLKQINLLKRENDINQFQNLMSEYSKKEIMKNEVIQKIEIQKKCFLFQGTTLYDFGNSDINNYLSEKNKIINKYGNIDLIDNKLNEIYKINQILSQYIQNINNLPSDSQYSPTFEILLKTLKFLKNIQNFDEIFGQKLLDIEEKINNDHIKKNKIIELEEKIVKITDEFKQVYYENSSLINARVIMEKNYNDQIQSFQENYKEKPEYEENLVTTLENNILNCEIDIEKIDKRRNYLIKQISINKKQEDSKKIKEFEKNYNMTKEILYKGLNEQGFIESNKDINEQIIENIKITLKKSLTYKQSKENKLEEFKQSIKEISLSEAMKKQEKNQIEQNLIKNAFTSFSNSFIHLNSEAEYQSLKVETKNNENNLAIEKFIKDHLYGYLLKRSHEENKCEFCGHNLNSSDFSQLEKNKWKNSTFEEKHLKNIDIIEKRLSELKTKKKNWFVFLHESRGKSCRKNYMIMR